MLDEVSGFAAAHAGKFAGEDHHFSFEGAAGGFFYDLIHEDPGISKLVDHHHVLHVMEVVVEATGDDFTDAFGFLDVGSRGFHERGNGVIFLCYQFRPFSTKEANAQAKEKLCEASAFAVGDSGHQVLRTLLTHPLDLLDVFHFQLIEIGGVIHQTVGQEAIHHRRTKAFDIHGVAGGEVDQFFSHHAAALGIGAAESCLPFYAGYLTAANRAGLWHFERLLRAISFVFQDFGDFRDDFPGLVNPHVVAFANVFFADEVQVVQRRPLHRGAGEVHRRQIGRWCQDAGAAHGDHDPLDASLRFFRRILVGHGPLGILHSSAQAILLREVIHLDDHAIGIIAQVMALGFPLVHAINDALDGSPLAIIRIHLEMEIRQLLEQFFLRVDFHTFYIP